MGWSEGRADINGGEKFVMKWRKERWRKIRRDSLRWWYKGPKPWWETKWSCKWRMLSSLPALAFWRCKVEDHISDRVVIPTPMNNAC